MKIATLLSPVLAISLKNTPPLNEVYETLLRVKHDSKGSWTFYLENLILFYFSDGHEKLLLELSDLSKDWQKNQSENDSIISSLKSDLSKMKKDLNSAEKKISSSETDHEALKKLMDKIVSDLQQKMDLAETTINQQHNQAQVCIDIFWNFHKKIFYLVLNLIFEKFILTPNWLLFRNLLKELTTKSAGSKMRFPRKLPNLSMRATRFPRVSTKSRFDKKNSFEWQNRNSLILTRLRSIIEKFLRISRKERKRIFKELIQLPNLRKRHKIV